MAHITRQQRLLARKVFVQRADRDARLERHRAGRQALPAFAFPNPNKGIVDGLHGEAGTRLRRALQRLGPRGAHRCGSGCAFRTRQAMGLPTVEPLALTTKRDTHMNDTTITITRLLTDKQTLNHSRIDTRAISLPLARGEALLKISRVAITTNNITYAAFGDAMQYWDFFPTQDEAWGHMPVWGFADVVASTVSGVERGERFFGYFPVASHLRVVPERVTPRGFYDGAGHRKSLTSAYNQYTRCSQDPAYKPERENHLMIVRPLFITSFMLADFLQDNAYFGAKQLVVSSASSKTAYGTAFCLEGQRDVELVALTSKRNRAFVEGLGAYQQTATYETLETIRRDRPTMYVDFSGDETLRERVHLHFGDALVYDCYAGSAQNTRFLRDTGLPGPAPTFYFAPVQIRKRNADWGRAGRSTASAMQKRFIRHVSNAAGCGSAEIRAPGCDGVIAEPVRRPCGSAESGTW